MVNVSLSVHDRIVLLNILPKQGDITTVKIVRVLREDLSFNEDEHALLNLRHENGRTYWNPLPDKEIVIGKKAESIIVSALEDMNKSGTLQEDHIPLYERFVVEDDEDGG